MKILLLGAGGQVGWELRRSLAVLGEVVAPGRRSGPLCGDLADLEGLARTVREVKPALVVNAAAYTAVDKAESEPELAEIVNARAPRVLASEAEAIGAWMVHYSTDYVFDGSGERAWREDDATGPLNVYGSTKLEGEAAVRGSCSRHLIFRTSWVYAARGGNFARTMLRLAADRERLSVIDDQTGAPTGADLLADVTAHAINRAMADPEKAGLYHLSASGETTWNGYARFVLAQAVQQGLALKAAPESVDRVASNAFPTAAKRPLNSRLDTSKLRSAFGLSLPPWPEGVARMITEII